MRADVGKKKLRMFKQQRHFAKDTIYQDNVVAPVVPAIFRSRMKVREDRREKFNFSSLDSKQALVPRLERVDHKKAVHLQEVFKKIQINREKGETKPVNTLIPRIVLSDFEELKERQKIIYYDKVWARAENAFIEKKKAAAGIA